MGVSQENALLRALGVRVRQLRDERGWSRRALAERTDLSERFLAQIESGEGNPSVQSLSRLARALETTPADLLASPPRARVVALLGLRGAGKSSVGGALAERTGAVFIELDALIEEAAGLALGEIFELHGEGYYRAREREALERVLAGGHGADSGVILAAGGGIVTHPENFSLLRANATTVWLRATPGEHWDRVVAQGDHRPMANDPLAKTHLRELLARREDLYRTADQTIDTSGASVESIVDRLAPLLMV
jgi:XRE family aerobic/anaerobic benzoate catabolism transcriptional regulator